MKYTYTREYTRWLNRMHQEIADKKEMSLMARLRALPASDEEIQEMRDFVTKDFIEAKWHTPTAARIASDDFFLKLLDHGILGPGLDVKGDT